MDTTATKNYSAKAILDRADFYSIRVILDEHRTNVIVEYPGSIEFDVLFKALDVIRDSKESIIEHLREN